MTFVLRKYYLDDSKIVNVWYTQASVSFTYISWLYIDMVLIEKTREKNKFLQP